MAGKSYKISHFFIIIYSYNFAHEEDGVSGVDHPQIF